MNVSNLRKNWREGLFAVVAGFLLFASTSTPASATAGINRQVNFQGKLVNADGTNVADTTYTIRFGLYNDPTLGTDTSGCTSNCLWTENNTSVTTKDGVFRVSLGSVTTFASSSVDFNQDTLWLGIKVGSDAEMTPRVQFTAVPYALTAEKVNGLSVTNNGGNTLNIAANKTFTVSNTLTLSGTDSTSFSFPSTSGGVVITSNAPTQTITSTQTSGTGLALADNTNITAATTGESITLSGTGAFDQTGLKFALSGANGTNLNDIVGSSVWKVSTGGVGTFASGSNVTSGGASYFQVGSTGSSGSFARMYADLNAVGDFALTDGSANSFFYTFVNGSTASLIPKGASGIGLNVTSPHAILDVEGGNTSGNAALIVNQNGVNTNDIFTASASGATKFSVLNSGTLKIFGSSSGSVGLAVQSAAGSVTYTFPASAINGNVLSTDGSGNLSWVANGACGSCLIQVPGSTGANTVTPTASGVVGLTVNGTSNGTTTADAVDINTIPATGLTATNGLLVQQNGAGTTTNGIQIQRTSGTLTNGLTFSGTMTNLISATNFTVTNTGVLSVVGGTATADITTVTAGNRIIIQPLNNAATSATGGILALKGGPATGTSGVGGNLNLDAGNGGSGGSAGSINIASNIAQTVNIGSFANASTVVNIGTTSTGATTISSGISSATGLSIVENSITSGKGVNISATGITAGGIALAVQGGTAVTTGEDLDLNGAVFVHTNNTTGKLANFAFTDSSTDNTGGHTTKSIGLSISKTFGATGASATHEIYGEYIQALTISGSPTEQIIAMDQGLVIKEGQELLMRMDCTLMHRVVQRLIILLPSLLAEMSGLALQHRLALFKFPQMLLTSVMEQ